MTRNLNEQRRPFEEKPAYAGFFMTGPAIEIYQRGMHYQLSLSKRALHEATVNARILLENGFRNMSLGRGVQLGIFATVIR